MKDNKDWFILAVLGLLLLAFELYLCFGWEIQK